MAGRGTGVPLVFDCAKCHGRRFDVTGRTRKLYGRQASNRVQRTSKFAAEYECRLCNHKGWSRHIDVTSRLGVEP